LSSLSMMHGGEIFVPKIPSMKVVDLTRAMAPDLPHRIVGIRPGEKLHEVLVPEDDARTAVEYPDRYIIQPALSFWRADSHTSSGAKPVAEGFRYSSDSNSEWLDQEGIKALLDEAPD